MYEERYSLVRYVGRFCFLSRNKNEKKKRDDIVANDASLIIHFFATTQTEDGSDINEDAQKRLFTHFCIVFEEMTRTEGSYYMAGDQ